jgi:hypothetical protein
VDEILQKPTSIRHAEIALWLYIIWAGCYGTFDMLRQLPQIEDVISTQLSDFVSFSPEFLRKSVLAGSAIFVVVSAFVLLRIGAGKQWARSTTLWGFVLSMFFMAVPPYKEPLEYATDVPSVLLQTYALWLLYTSPGKIWFRPRRKLAEVS